MSVAEEDLIKAKFDLAVTASKLSALEDLGAILAATQTLEVLLEQVDRRRKMMSKFAKRQRNSMPEFTPADGQFLSSFGITTLEDGQRDSRGGA
jgi:hypothetical protein